jgi:hypothetical protein
VGDVMMSDDLYSYRQTAAWIDWDHENGAMLQCSDGSIHLLTLWERLAMRASITTIDALDKKYRYDDCKG